MHRECGFIRLKPDTNKVAFISAQNTGTSPLPSQFVLFSVNSLVEEGNGSTHQSYKTLLDLYEVFTPASALKSI